MSASPGGIALLLVDVINGFDFEGSEHLAQGAAAAAPHIERLAASARERRVPVIYVNDNFGMWQSDFRAVADSCLREGQPGRDVVRRLLPKETDYFVLKPRHSGFLGTPLEALLRHLGVHVVLLAGFATDLCVLFTALDAHARGFSVALAADATAANGEDRQRTALALFEHTLCAPIVRSSRIDWGRLACAEPRQLF